MRFHGRQQLAYFGGGRVIVQQQAPHGSINGAGLNGMAQVAGDERLNGGQTSHGVARKLRQPRQGGRILTCLQQGKRMMPAVHEQVFERIFLCS